MPENVHPEAAAGASRGRQGKQNSSSDAGVAGGKPRAVLSDPRALLTHLPPGLMTSESPEATRHSDCLHT